MASSPWSPGSTAPASRLCEAPAVPPGAPVVTATIRTAPDHGAITANGATTVNGVTTLPPIRVVSSAPSLRGPSASFVAHGPPMTPAQHSRPTFPEAFNPTLPQHGRQAFPESAQLTPPQYGRQAFPEPVQLTPSQYGRQAFPESAQQTPPHYGRQAFPESVQLTPSQCGRQTFPEPAQLAPSGLNFSDENPGRELAVQPSTTFVCPGPVTTVLAGQPTGASSPDLLQIDEKLARRITAVLRECRSRLAVGERRRGQEGETLK